MSIKAKSVWLQITNVVLVVDREILQSICPLFLCQCHMVRAVSCRGEFMALFHRLLMYILFIDRERVVHKSEEVDQSSIKFRPKLVYMYFEISHYCNLFWLKLVLQRNHAKIILGEFLAFCAQVWSHRSINGQHYVLCLICSMLSGSSTTVPVWSLSRMSPQQQPPTTTAAAAMVRESSRKKLHSNRMAPTALEEQTTQPIVVCKRSNKASGHSMIFTYTLCT